MMLGLLITDKLARSWPGAAAAFAVHEYVSLLGVTFSLFHALMLLGDRYIGYQLINVLLPFASTEYRPFWTGLGQLGFYVWLLVAVSFYVRRRIGPNTWKLIHFASFFTFLVALMHGLASGTDTGAPWAQGVYWFAGGSILFLTAYRVAANIAGPERRTPSQSVATRAPES
jgi:predicted ferric reductase